MTATQADAHTVTLIDPNRLSREGVARLLREHGYVIKNGCSDLVGLIDYASSDGHRTDFCIIDSSALSDDIESDLRNIRKHVPDTRIIVFIEGSESNMRV